MPGRDYVAISDEKPGANGAEREYATGLSFQLWRKIAV
jgi:hypothetical protein